MLLFLGLARLYDQPPEADVIMRLIRLGVHTVLNIYPMVGIFHLPERRHYLQGPTMQIQIVINLSSNFYLIFCYLFFFFSFYFFFFVLLFFVVGRINLKQHSIFRIKYSSRTSTFVFYRIHNLGYLT